jgi:hypothetical protein
MHRRTDPYYTVRITNFETTLHGRSRLAEESLRPNQEIVHRIRTPPRDDPDGQRVFSADFDA